MVALCGDYLRAVLKNHLVTPLNPQSDIQSLESLTTLHLQTEEGICTLTINRPDKLNALNKDVFSELNTALDHIEASADTRAVIITGAGEKAFVAGADIAEFTGLDRAGAEALSRRGQATFQRIEDSRKPIVAAVNGFALGGGCELAMACHFRVAAEGARFGQPEVSLGLIPGYGGTQRLTQLVGKGKSMELTLTGDMLGAEEAKTWGLVNHVFPAADLLAETKKIVSKILTKAPVAVGLAIGCINDAVRGVADGFEEEVRRFGDCFETEDVREGTGAFLEKRKAVFAGR